ncbi:hypothetical protein [Sorangium sp. So ce1153]
MAGRTHAAHAGVAFAAVGGIVALWLRGLPFSISAGAPPRAAAALPPAAE